MTVFGERLPKEALLRARGIPFVVSDNLWCVFNHKVRCGAVEQKDRWVFSPLGT